MHSIESYINEIEILRVHLKPFASTYAFLMAIKLSRMNDMTHEESGEIVLENDETEEPVRARRDNFTAPSTTISSTRKLFSSGSKTSSPSRRCLKKTSSVRMIAGSSVINLPLNSGGTNSVEVTLGENEERPRAKPIVEVDKLGQFLKRYSINP